MTDPRDEADSKPDTPDPHDPELERSEAEGESEDLSGPVASTGENVGRPRVTRGTWLLAFIRVGLVLVLGFFVFRLWIQEYAPALFVAVPVPAGFWGGYYLRMRARVAALELSFLASIAASMVVALTFVRHYEEIPCILLALPFLFGATMLGSSMGVAWAAMPTRSPHVVLGIPVLLAFAWNTSTFEPTSIQIETVIEIDAPPDVVWRHVVEFPEIERDDEPWTYALGFPQPRHCWIEGEGVGAIRHCVFNVDEFTEPVRVWQPGEELTFGCSHQPAGIDAILQVTQGQFLLEEVSPGRTRVIGSTWIDLSCGPTFYFGPWCEWIIGDIHEDVLQHVRRRAEAE
ncbi:MAG: SRPBCC family protein [Planctomycetota bacterium]